MKKVIILSGLQNKTEYLSTDRIFGTAQLYSYFLRKEFEKIGIETEGAKFAGVNEPPKIFRNIINLLPKGDHVVCVEQRAFRNRNHAPFLVPEIKKKIPGKVTTICDNNSIVGPEDMLYYAVPAKAKPKSLYVGWGADPAFCYPEKDPSKIRILVDHGYYGTKVRDWSDQILKDVADFSRKNKKVEIRRFISGGIETLDINNIWKDKYNRNGLPFTEACAEYRQAHVFIVTHPESMGLSVLESAMSGALVVSPKGFIRRELLRDLHHIEYTDSIPWKKVLDNINPQKASKMASKYTWSNVASKIAKDLYK